jgi:hypothetical protein
MATTAADQRTTKIEQFIVLEAITTFLTNLHDTAAGGEGGVLSGVIGLSFEDNAFRLSRDEFDELFPDDDSTESAEFKLASIRNEILTAEIFSTLATNPEALQERAFYFQRLAARHLSEFVKAEEA